MLETAQVQVTKIKEESLNEGIIEMDLTALSSINPTGDNSELANFASVPPQLQRESQESLGQEMETH